MTVTNISRGIAKLLQRMMDSAMLTSYPYNAMMAALDAEVSCMPDHKCSRIAPAS
jgi:hypothetical protein